MMRTFTVAKLRCTADESVCIPALISGTRDVGLACVCCAVRELKLLKIYLECSDPTTDRFGWIANAMQWPAKEQVSLNDKE